MYKGLTSEEVLRRREQYGENVLSQQDRSSLADAIRLASHHWISITLAAITVATLGFATWLDSSLGMRAWTMPAVSAVSTVLVVMAGICGAFKDPLFKILITAFALSMGIAVYEYVFTGAEATGFFEPLGIICALLLAVGVAFLLERGNEKTFRSLNSMGDDLPVKAVRDGQICEIARRELVPGDIVRLDTGEEIPADCRLLEADTLSVNESTLTGEPLAHKSADPKDTDPEATYPTDRVMKGTTITEGYCTAEVVATGDSTESGRVFEAAQTIEEGSTPLSRQLAALAAKITKVSYALAVLIFVGRMIVWLTGDGRHFDAGADWLPLVHYVLSTVMMAVTLIVVAVPEGLPMSVTLSLALSMRRLMRENTLPRTMHSCETMGATTVICTDKTGTLTQNRMQVAEALTLDSPEPDFLSAAIAANTTADLDRTDPARVRAIGNPTEGALLLWLEAKGKDYSVIRQRWETESRLPFSTENKFMATVARNRQTGHRYLLVKGAPEIVLRMCRPGTDSPQNRAALLGWQNKGMRTLALAYSALPEAQADTDLLRPDNLSLAALFAIADPVRTDVPEAIRNCTRAGIKVKVVTGDTAATATEIARQIGLWTDADTELCRLTGPEFAALSDDEAAKRIGSLKIMSRARPKDKERLVRMLRSQGEVVAVTGDGTNDAPALNAADVGLSMGDGTAVAKEASDMTIADNSFHTIANAVQWGRSLYRNIQRFILFQMTVNVVACSVVVIGAFTGAEPPLTVTQMLWVNIIMDTFAALALASLPPTPAVMADKPRRIGESIVSRPMLRRILLTAAAQIAALAALLLVMQHKEVAALADIVSQPFGSGAGLSRYEQTLLFTIFVMLQFWNLFKSRRCSLTGPAANAAAGSSAAPPAGRAFWLVAAAILIGQVAIVSFGGPMFNCTPLHFLDWLLIVAVTAVAAV